jgi:dTDP-D-glucose 4,6-dehydratase
MGYILQYRFGRDRRYAIDSSFAKRELKWKPLHNFREGLDATIDWYLNNRSWWERLLERTGRYLKSGASVPLAGFWFASQRLAPL